LYSEINKIKKMKMTLKIPMIILLSTAVIFWGNNSKVSAQSTPATGDAIIGKWTNEDKTRIIEFVKTGATYEAVIKEAPDKSLIGKKQITGLQFDGRAYKNGKVYLPKRGKTYPCTVSLKGDDTMELSAKAGFMSKSQTWTRVK
jgi:uncharacterized protein (DUF2147 family)